MEKKKNPPGFFSTCTLIGFTVLCLTPLNNRWEMERRGGYQFKILIWWRHIVKSVCLFPSAFNPSLPLRLHKIVGIGKSEASRWVLFKVFIWYLFCRAISSIKTDRLEIGSIKPLIFLQRSSRCFKATRRQLFLVLRLLCDFFFLIVILFNSYWGNSRGSPSFLLVSRQEAEWHCDEFTKGACFSRGKSEVGSSAASAIRISRCCTPSHQTCVSVMGGGE